MPKRQLQSRKIEEDAASSSNYFEAYFCRLRGNNVAEVGSERFHSSGSTMTRNETQPEFKGKDDWELISIFFCLGGDESI
jgi:hypothetical protein